MGFYRDRVNYKPHNINNLVILINGTHRVQGLDSFEAERNEYDVTITEVADGSGIFVEHPSLSGTVKIKFLEASASSDELWELLEGHDFISISAKDAQASKFSVSAQYARIMKRPNVKREKEPDSPEWVFTAVYLDIKGGSYALATV